MLNVLKYSNITSHHNYQSYVTGHHDYSSSFTSHCGYIDVPSLDYSLNVGLISLRELTNVFTKGTSRRSFAANLVRLLLQKKKTGGDC